MKCLCQQIEIQDNPDLSEWEAQWKNVICGVIAAPNCLESCHQSGLCRLLINIAQLNTLEPSSSSLPVLYLNRQQKTTLNQYQQPLTPLTSKQIQCLSLTKTKTGIFVRSLHLDTLPFQIHPTNTNVSTSFALSSKKNSTNTTTNSWIVFCGWVLTIWLAACLIVFVVFQLSAIVYATFVPETWNNVEDGTFDFVN